MVKPTKWVLAVIALACATAQEAEAISIAPRPDMDLSVPAGGSVVWGYEIVNDSAFWLSSDNSNALLDEPFAGEVDDAVAALALLELALDESPPSATIVSGKAYGSDGVDADAGLTAFEETAEWTVDVAAAVTDIPEPSTWLLLSSGLVAILLRAARRSR